MSSINADVVIPWFNVSSHARGAQNCVDVQQLADGTIQTRNSKRPEGAVIDYTKGEWAAFIQGVKEGKFDHTL